jgi:hypothetical protein
VRERMVGSHVKGIEESVSLVLLSHECHTFGYVLPSDYESALVAIRRSPLTVGMCSAL